MQTLVSFASVNFFLVSLVWDIGRVAQNGPGGHHPAVVEVNHLTTSLCCLQLFSGASVHLLLDFAVPMLLQLASMLLQLGLCAPVASFVALLTSLLVCSYSRLLHSCSWFLWLDGFVASALL